MSHFGNASVGDLGAGEVELLQLGQPLEMHQPGVSDMDDLVLELDAASISSTDQAAEPQDLTYVDIDTFLVGF